MTDLMAQFLSLTLALLFVTLVMFVCLAINKLRASSAVCWELLRIVLVILFLPFVLVWKVATAGSDCGCCCDEDD
jgi:hypothetical protein